MDLRQILLGILLVSFVAFAPVNIRQQDPRKPLAEIYCGSCHQQPDPNILTKKSWNFLLTDMGFRLGVVDYKPISDISPMALLHMTTKEQILREAGVIPEQATISNDHWTAVRSYYLDHAPEESLPQENKQPITETLDLFHLKVPKFRPKAPVFTLTRIDSKNGRILLGNQRDQSLTILDDELKIDGRYYNQGVLVDVWSTADNLYLLDIGDLMGRSIGLGKGFVQLYRGPLDDLRNQKHLVQALHRPVDIEFADLNQDGTEELIVCNFGDVSGNVSLYTSDGSLITELIDAPGAIRSQVHDFNKDGRPDIIVLLGDARENLSLFLNQGQHKYRRKVLVECHSSYGHTYFELQDFNKDGHMDILAVNGDTDADPFNTLKNYHGIRIYLNDGRNNFTVGYFYPMYGAHFAKAGDFDEDGDLDIAASAFFPDFSSELPEQFTYLENQGNLDFKPHTHKETYHGRWMTMDIGDYDLDGDIDIVLGGGYLPLGMAVEFNEKYQSMLDTGKAVLVFENVLK